MTNHPPPNIKNDRTVDDSDARLATSSRVLSPRPAPNPTAPRREHLARYRVSRNPIRPQHDPSSAQGTSLGRKPKVKPRPDLASHKNRLRTDSNRLDRSSCNLRIPAPFKSIHTTWEPQARTKYPLPYLALSLSTYL